MSGPEKDEPQALAGARGEKSSHEKPEPQINPQGRWIQGRDGVLRFYRRERLRELFARDLARDVFGGTWSRPFTEAPRSPGDVKAELDRMARDQAEHQRARRAESELRRIALELKAQAQQSFAGTIAAGGAS